MLSIRDALRQMWRDVRSQKLRTFLTVFGIVWGTVAVTLLLAFGRGLQRQMIINAAGIGDQICIAWPGLTSTPFQGLGKGRKIRLSEDDVDAIRREAQGLNALSSEYSQTLKLNYNTKTLAVDVSGVSPEFGGMRNINPQADGRFLNPTDVTEERRVLVIGNKLAEDMFGKEPAVGKTVLLGGSPFLIVGVMEKKIQQSSYSGRDHSKAFIPGSTFRALTGEKWVDNLIYQPANPRESAAVTASVREVLGRRLRFDIGDKEALSVWDTTEEFAFFAIFFLSFRLFLGIIGSFTLIVGGIGVSNIMNVVVEERTREVGIKMAIGARAKWILRQFLLETLLITSLGGAIGFAFSFAVCAIFPKFGVTEYVGNPDISFSVAALTAAILGLTGLVAGYFPAKEAARLDPVVAMSSNGEDLMTLRDASLVLQLFFRSARLQKKRATLTIASLAWGTVTILLLLAFGEGLKRQLASNEQAMGTNLAILWAGETSKPYKGLAEGRPIRPKLDDVAYIRERMPDLDAVWGELTSWRTALAYGRKTINARVIGTSPEYGDRRKHFPKPGGRFLNAHDEEEKRRVAFLGNNVARDLFAAEEPVGKTILINNSPFTVIGVMQRKRQSSTYGGPDAEHAVIPETTFKAIFGKDQLNVLVFRVKRPQDMEGALLQLNQVLGPRLGFDPDDPRVFGVWNTVEGQKMSEKILLGLELFFGIIGALTLIIGGVGVANIMYAVVKERTREIGVKMALGARRRWITGPFILEGMVYTLLGGLFGALISIVVITLLGLIPQEGNDVLEFLGKPTLSWPIGAATVAILGTAGLLAGYFPARRAASIDPATTLRYE